MVRQNDISGYRILVIAILVSLAWHLFWIFAVKVVAAPAGKGRAAFSKVSFLGPILTKVSMQVSAQPSARSFLEKRFAAAVARSPAEAAGPAGAPDARKAAEGSAPSPVDARLPSVIDEAVSGDKLRPDFGTGQ